MADMTNVHLCGVDLNLLPVLEALLRLRNVTAAAAEVGLSQPAASRALARLRAWFDDPLLVRAAGGLALTPAARALLPAVAEASVALKAVYAPAARPDPREVERTVRIAATDVQAVLVGPALMRRLATAAPRVDVRFEVYEPDLFARFERGELDFAFALASSPLPPGAESQRLARDELALVMRRGHPWAERDWTLADYAEVDHVAIRIFGDGLSEIDAALALLGKKRRIALSVPHFVSALAAVGGGDLVTTVSRAYAERMADRFALAVRAAPVADPVLNSVLVWSRLHGADPFLVWMRDEIAAATAEGYGGVDP
jgi:DNA-binding transcriptional LysR family regulator